LSRRRERPDGVRIDFEQGDSRLCDPPDKPSDQSDIKRWMGGLLRLPLGYVKILRKFLRPEAKRGSMQPMAARVLPLKALLLSNPQSQAGHESAMALEHTASGTPFHVGDQLQLDPASSKKLEVKEVTILQMGCWPWVLVRCEGSATRSEVWINFGRIRGASRIPTRAPAGTK
jgi:hypothetical protein